MLGAQPYSYSILFQSCWLKIIVIAAMSKAIIVAKAPVIAVAEKTYQDIMVYQYKLRMVYLNSAVVAPIAVARTFCQCTAWVNIAIVSSDIAMETSWILGFLAFAKAYRTKKGRDFWL